MRRTDVVALIAYVARRRLHPTLRNRYPRCAPARAATIDAGLPGPQAARSQPYQVSAPDPTSSPKPRLPAHSWPDRSACHLQRSGTPTSRPIRAVDGRRE
ncbi:hypothetical protein PENSPDRAFT_418616 [Peniophora sp. CONT]|nr:hypothetical protein PENSPDRAFT_418616 [Peniophora sp. CONT]